MASARQIRDEIMKMTIIVNSDPAQKAIYDLSQKNQELKEKNVSLNESMKEVRSTLGKNSDEFKKLSSELDQNKSSISSNAKEMERLRGEMDINQMTMQQLRKEAALLRTNLSNMVPGSEQSIELQRQLDAVNERMGSVRNGADRTSSSFRNLADRFNHYSGIITAGIAIFVGFGLSVQSLIDRNNKLVDSQTAVAKTVNMTKEEVEELTKSFSDFDTRTSRIDLLKIAETGGRLGVSKAEIKDFVQEVDKANVALGDGFTGGVEAVTDTLGKLKNLYRETKELNMADAINQIGSAMNELGANGAATEQNIGDFALRLGSLPDKLKPTIAEALALGAAFEESGINAERGGTAYSTFIRNAATNADKFAKVMNISRQEVEAMMNKDPLEFFLKFSEGMKGMDTTKLAQTMEYLKMGDQYVISVMGSASENTDRFRKSIELSNSSLVEATSLTTEFNKVNNNTAAIFEKVQKKFLGMFTSETVANTLNFLISVFGKFIGAVEDSEGTVTDFRNTLFVMLKIIAIATISTLSYNAAILLTNTSLVGLRAQLLSYTIIQKLNNLLNQTGTVFQTAWNLAIGLGGVAVGRLVGATSLQTAAQIRLNAAMATNPFGAVIALVTLLIGAYVAFGMETDKTIQKQNLLNDVRKVAAATVAKEKAELDTLIRTAQNENLSKEQRLNAIKRLNAISPEYLGFLTLENIKTIEATKAIKNYVAALDQRAMAEAIQSKKVEIMKKIVDEKTNKSSDYNDFTGETGNKVGFWLNNTFRSGPKLKENIDFNAYDKLSPKAQAAEFKTYMPSIQKAIIKRTEALNGYNSELKETNKLQEDFLFKNPKTNAGGDDDSPPSNYTLPGNDDKGSKASDIKANTAAEKLRRLEEQHQREMEALARKGEEASELSRQIELDIADAKIEAMQEGYDKEIDQIDIQEQRKLAEIDKKKVSKSEFDVLQKQIDAAKGKDKELFEQLKTSWTKNNEDLEQLKLEQIDVFENKRSALRVKSEQKWLNDQETAHQTEVGHIKREHDEELATYTSLAQLKEGLKGRIEDKEISRIRTWAEGKEALTKIYLKKELELQITHLESMVKLYEGLDLGILTPEQRESVMKFIDEAGNKIADFKAKIKGEDQTDEKKGAKVLNQRGSTDVLGMSFEDWDTMFSNLQNGTDALGTMVAAVGALQNAFGTYYQFLEANSKRDLQKFEQRNDTKKRSLKAQLDQGYINQETYKKLTIKADQELDKKKSELALRQAKRERAMQVASILTNTAMAIMSIWAQVPKFDFGVSAGILTGIVGALGAVQLGTVLATPLPTADGYEDGFGTEYPIERQQDGKRFNVRRKRLMSGLVDRPTHFIAGENNRVEMVIDNPTWTKYPAELKQAIYSANSRAKGFEGGFNKEVQSSGSDEMLILMMGTISRMNSTLDNIQKNGIEAKIAKNARNGKDAYEMQKEYLDLNNKNKH